MTATSGSDYFEGAEAARERAREQVKAAFDHDPLDKPPTRTCASCGVESTTWRSRCPACNKRFDRRWPWLTDPMRWALVALAVALLGTAVVVATPLVTESKRERAERLGRERSERNNALRTQMVRDQTPQFGTSPTSKRDDSKASDGERRATRHALVVELEAEILTDARARIAAKRLDGPVKAVNCGPLVRAPSVALDADVLTKRIGRYDCVAIKSDVVRDGKVVALFGHPFVASINFPKGSFVWCRTGRSPGESGAELIKVEMDPRCIGAEGATRVGGGFVLPED